MLTPGCRTQKGGRNGPPCGRILGVDLGEILPGLRRNREPGSGVDAAERLWHALSAPTRPCPMAGPCRRRHHAALAEEESRPANAIRAATKRQWGSCPAKSPQAKGYVGAADRQQPAIELLSAVKQNHDARGCRTCSPASASGSPAPAGLRARPRLRPGSAPGAHAAPSQDSLPAVPPGGVASSCRSGSGKTRRCQDGSLRQTRARLGKMPIAHVGADLAAVLRGALGSSGLLPPFVKKEQDFVAFVHFQFRQAGYNNCRSPH